MHHQFLELAGIDITKDAMEVYPTCHYSMGGVRVNADTAAATVPGLFAAGEIAGGLHGANRLGGNSLTDLLVFGRRAGMHAAEYVSTIRTNPNASRDQIDDAAAALLAPFSAPGDESPFDVQTGLQDVMQEHVGIFREEAGMRTALERIAALRQRLSRVRVSGTRQYNPGWHATRDLHSMLTVAEVVTRSALERKETRGGHSRTDYLKTDAALGRVNIVAAQRHGTIELAVEPIPQIPDELKRIVEEHT